MTLFLSLVWHWMHIQRHKEIHMPSVSDTSSGHDSCFFLFFFSSNPSSHTFLVSFFSIPPLISCPSTVFFSTVFPSTASLTKRDSFTLSVSLFVASLTLPLIVFSFSFFLTNTTQTLLSRWTHTAPPKWIVEPQNVIAVNGKEVMIHCLAEGFPDPMIEWKRSTMPSMNQRSSLLLSSSSSSSSSSPFLASVVSSPVSSSSSSLTSLPSSSMTSTSSSSTFKPIIFDGKFSKIESNSSLEIKHIDKSDEGYYMCKASNGLGSGISTVVYLAVKIPAHFREEFRVETVAKSSPLVITCEAIGDKPLFVSWKKDGQSFAVNPLSRVQSTLLDSSSSSSSSSGAVISDKRYVITETITDQGLTSQIKVESADRRDSSLYTCLASNAYGSDEINLQVIVQGMYCLLSLLFLPISLHVFLAFVCLLLWFFGCHSA